MSHFDASAKATYIVVTGLHLLVSMLLTRFTDEDTPLVAHPDRLALSSVVAQDESGKLLAVLHISMRIIFRELHSPHSRCQCPC